MELRWKITITYNNDGKYLYESTEPDALCAVAVATKQMFKRCVWLTPAETRITKVELTDIRYTGHEDDVQSGDTF